VKTFDWVGLFRNHPVLSGLDDPHVACLLSDDASAERSYAPGEVIVREGESGDSFFLIGAGSVDVTLSGTGGQTIALATLPRGETFGEMGLFENRPRCATVRARETCIVLEVKGTELRRLGEAHPDVEFNVLLKVSERLRNDNEQILALHLKDADGASRAKDEFLAMLGHELRNPLGAISAAIHVLDAESNPGDETARLRQIITHQTGHLSRLVEDLLDVSRVVSGKVTLQRRRESLKTLAGRVVSSFAELGRTAQHVVSVTGEDVNAHGDATRIEQVISNLLDNALKYTPAGGRIEITTAADGGEAVLRIRDTGGGIEADLLPHVFDLFVQADQSVDRSVGGLGLGLTLVKRLVELHGGTVWASSAGADQGSEFVIRIPRASDTGVSAESPETEHQGRARRIVIVEDNRDFRDALRFLLESWGHEVYEADTGDQGLELIRTSHPEVVLLDLGLPGLDGYAIAQAVRAEPGGDAAVLVAITGYGGSQVCQRAMDVGFDAHLTKPVNLEALERILLGRGVTVE
jgi:signal transduction histidine kinase/CheY-like chemotaxis protein